MLIQKVEQFSHKTAGRIDREWTEIEQLTDLAGFGPETQVVNLINAGLARLAQEASYRKAFAGGKVDLLAIHGGGDHARAPRATGKAVQAVASKIQEGILAAVTQGKTITPELMAEIMAAAGVTA